jgi:hypothetical protein
MAKSKPFSAVLRISEVRITKAALEAALEARLDRYEPERSGSLHYAQVDIPVADDIWIAVVDCIGTIGSRISSLRQAGSIGAASVDLVVSFKEGSVALSIVIPSHTAETVGRYGIDIQLSIYLTSENQ